MNGGKAKGEIGALLVLVTRNNDGEIVDHATVVVDGETIKVDTWYRLECGKVEVVK